MGAFDVLQKRSPFAWHVLPSGVCVQLRRPSPVELQAAGLTAMQGLVDAVQAEAEAVTEAKIAAGMTTPETEAKAEAKKVNHRVAKMLQRPGLYEAMERAWDAWVVASVVAIGIAADEVAPGTYGEAPPTHDGGPFEQGRIALAETEASAADRVLHIGAFAPSERAAIATAAERHTSAKERLRPVGAPTSAARGV